MAFMRLVMATASLLMMLLLVSGIRAHGAYDDLDGHSHAWEREYEYDPKGYMLTCLCAGGWGNQMEYLAGALAFAKDLDRTLILPPFIKSYDAQSFTKYIQLSPLEKFHRVIPAEDFMEQIAPDHWPQDLRVGFCWAGKRRQKGVPNDCGMKKDDPMKPYSLFWETLGVEFSEDEYLPNYLRADLWKENRDLDNYPVLALRELPARFPMLAEHYHIQKFIHLSHNIQRQGDKVIEDIFNNQPYIGIHLRNDDNWVYGCKHHGKQIDQNVVKFVKASPQCVPLTEDGDIANGSLHVHQCYQTEDIITRELLQVVEETGITNIFVATDHNPMLSEIREALYEHDPFVYHLDPETPQVDQHILIQSSYFIGNCMSSFTSFVRRSRDVQDKGPTYYWYHPY